MQVNLPDLIYCYGDYEAITLTLSALSDIIDDNWLMMLGSQEAILYKQ